MASIRSNPKKKRSRIDVSDTEFMKAFAEQVASIVTERMIAHQLINANSSTPGSATRNSIEAIPRSLYTKKESDMSAEERARWRDFLVGRLIVTTVYINILTVPDSFN